MKKKKKRDWKTLIAKWVLLSFIIPIGYIIYKIFTAPTVNTEEIVGLRLQSDYVLMLLQCLLGIAAIILPAMISKKKNFIIPSNMYLVYVLFLYGAIFLGEVRNFYNTVPHFDTLLHTFSGFMLGALGFSIINILNKEERFHLNLSPIFVAFFAFCFALALGVVWEIYEFAADGILGLNMQRFTLENGILLVGREALQDTMKDLIVDAVGAFIVSALGYLSLKYQTNFIDKLLIKFKTSQYD